MTTPDRVAMVTGGGRGLGRAIAARLAAEGFAVAVVARSLEQVEASAAAIRDLGGHARGFSADVTDPGSLDRAIARIGEWAGRLDAVVGAAGRLRAIGPVGAVDPSEWWQDVETALRGTFATVRATLPLVRKSATGSFCVLVGPGHNGDLAHASGYAAAQAGLVRLVETWAEEWRRDGLPIFAVNPGLVPTEVMNHLLHSPEGRRFLPQFTEAFAEGKEVGPEVVAEMVAWLATNRPMGLSGRVVPAPMTPAILETRLDRIVEGDWNRLRLR